MSVAAGVDFDTNGMFVVRSFGSIDGGESTTFPGVELTHDDLRADEIYFPGALSFDRLRHVSAAIPLDFWDGVDVVGIEDPRATNPLMRATIGKLARVQGAIVATIPLAVDVYQINATEWRTAVGLKGNCKKPEVYEWAVTNGFYLHDGRTAPQDLADAYALLRAVEGLVAGEWARKPRAPRKKKTA